MHSWAFEHSDPIKGSPGSHSQSVSCSVGITNSFWLLAFSLSVSFALSRQFFLCSLVSQTPNCARLLIAAIPVLKAAVKLAKVKSHGNNVCDVHVVIAHMNKYGCTNKQTNKHAENVLRTSQPCILHTAGW